MEPITTSIALKEVLGPILASVATEVGYNMLSGLLGGNSPYASATQQQLAIGNTLIPQLQRQAAGLPTMATRAQMRQLNSQITRAQQSYAASARRQGLAQYGLTTPARAQQSRLRAAGIEAQANLLGNAQQTAQQLLTGLYGQGYAGQAALEAQQAAQREKQISGIGAYLGRFMQAYKQNSEDPRWQEAFDKLVQLLELYSGGSLTGGQQP